MTVSNTTRQTSVTGSATIGQEVPFSFPVLDTSELKVVTRVTATGVETVLTETTNFTVELDDEGGTVTMVQAVPATTQIHVYRDTPKTQTLDLTAGGAFNAENVEAGFDKSVKQIIDVNEEVDRSIREAVTDTSTASLELPMATERASCYLTFDASGNVTVTTSLATGTANISTYGATIIDDANASAAQTTLGFSTFIKTLFSLTTAASVLTTLGVTSFIQTLLDDTDAATARATLGVINITDNIVCYANAVVCDNEEVVIYQ